MESKASRFFTFGRADELYGLYEAATSLSKNIKQLILIWGFYGENPRKIPKIFSKADWLQLKID